MPRAWTMTLRWGACSEPSGPGTRPGLTVSNQYVPDLKSVCARPKPVKADPSGTSTHRSSGCR